MSHRPVQFPAHEVYNVAESREIPDISFGQRLVGFQADAGAFCLGGFLSAQAFAILRRSPVTAGERAIFIIHAEKCIKAQAAQEFSIPPGGMND